MIDAKTEIKHLAYLIAFIYERLHSDEALPEDAENLAYLRGSLDATLSAVEFYERQTKTMFSLLKEVLA